MTPKRREFNWSLRTFLLALTLAGSWIGWQVNTVHRRQEIITTMDQNGLWLSERKPSYNGFGGIAVGWKPLPGHPDLPVPGRPQIPWFRALLGDVPIAGVYVEHRERAEELAQVFPEASLYYQVIPAVSPMTPH
jgi:hypothetical protein